MLFPNYLAIAAGHIWITMASMITAAQWVPRGFAAPFPEKYKFDEAEFERIAELAKLQLDDAEDDLKEAQEKSGENEDGKDEEDGMQVDDGKPSEKIEWVLQL